MSDSFLLEPMLEMYIFEINQLIDQLELIIIDVEKNNSINSSLDEIFRIMHTIKGSSAMMLFNGIAELAHSIEDLFFYYRENKAQDNNYTEVCDIMLLSIDFIKKEIFKLQNGNETDGNCSDLINRVNNYLDSIKNSDVNNMSSKQREIKSNNYYISPSKNVVIGETIQYSVHIRFVEDCKMENVRAFTIVHRLKDIVTDIRHYPQNIIDSNDSEEIIKNEGFKVVFNTNLDTNDINKYFDNQAFIKEVHIRQIKIEDVNGFLCCELDNKLEKQKETNDNFEVNISNKQNVISVNVNKLDLLMDLVGELVITEAMVTKNPDLVGLKLDNFYKAARQLRKITNDIQDVVMSARMVPLTSTFQKMNRIVRDVGKKLGKDVLLELIGHETEVDKNIIENIGDPLMHLVRNAMDHAIEDEAERIKNGKNKKGKITIQAKNTGRDVWIEVKDDGKGLDREKIILKAKEHGLLEKDENEYSDKEVFSLIFLPGFSTKEQVTEFSGRGVGMDVVAKNVQKIGGNIIIDSIKGKGTTVCIKIPLTLAIIDGMTINVGKLNITVPTSSIKECFRFESNKVIKDTDGNEMLLLRGECISILRLQEEFKIKSLNDDINNSIIIVIEYEQKRLCLLADGLIGQQQVVVKALPKYLKKVKGLSGCTLLGDGSVSLILDIPYYLGGA